MMGLLRWVMLLGMPVIFGCAGNPAAKPVAETGGYEPVTGEAPVCRYERATGSHMMRKRCFTQSELKQMSEQSKAWLRTGGRSGGPAPVRDAADPRDAERE